MAETSDGISFKTQAKHDFMVYQSYNLTLSSIYTHFNTLKKKALGKHSGKN